MGGLLVDAGAVVTCAHEGKAEPIVPNPFVSLSEQPACWVLVPWSIEGCPNPPPIASNGPCVVGVWTSPGTTRVTSFGMPLLAWPAESTTVLSGTPMVVDETQTRVTAE